MPASGRPSPACHSITFCLQEARRSDARSCGPQATIWWVTLELGGKSPVVVDRGSSLRRAAHSIAWGKLGNAGQTCVAPDYVLVADEELENFVTAFRSEVQRLYPDIASNPDYGTVITDRHYGRLVGLLDDARAKGARVREIGTLSTGQRRMHPRTFLPAIVTKVTDEMAACPKNP